LSEAALRTDPSSVRSVGSADSGSAWRLDKTGRGGGCSPSASSLFSDRFEALLDEELLLLLDTLRLSDDELLDDD
jgi:hypothetical protein